MHWAMVWFGVRARVALALKKPRKCVHLYGNYTADEEVGERREKTTNEE